MAAEPLEIQLLGDFRIRVGERVIPDAAWKLRKAAGIVKLLALEPTHRLHREQLLDTLWPELDSDAAANNFRYALHTARRVLDAGGLPRREGQYVTLGLSDAIWVDVQAFETVVSEAWRDDSLEAFQCAVHLYGGDLLPGDPYEEWVGVRRTGLKTSYLTALTQLARLHMKRNDSVSAVNAWQQVLEADPALEEAHVQIMLLHASAGRRHSALAQYDRLVQALDSELGIEPDPVSRELAGAIRSGQISETTASHGNERIVARSTLPAPATALIGRERELAEIRQALTAARLVTITGPGGAGKTRLAFELANRTAGAFLDDVFCVSLAPLSAADMVPMATLQALGINQSGSQTPAEALSEYLRERSALLVLDNFEHVVSAAPLISALLESCPSLKVLTTSRFPLRLRGEHEYPLRSLSDHASSALFVERSKAVRPDFEAVNEQHSAIVQICRKLDGLPLAIELAAARSRVLTPTALLERLEQPLALLTGGSRDLPDRQKTLRATIDWSYRLLPLDLQAFFRALAVFPGSWTLGSAGALCPDGLDSLDGVTLLVENSLVERLETDGEQRFSMLETIREFGLEQLVAAGDIEDVRLRHMHHFLALAERFAPDLRGPAGSAKHMELAAEHDNLRAALTLMLSHDAARALHVIVGLEKYWFARGSFSEWEYWIDTSLSRATGAQPEDRARALHQLAFVHFYGGRPEQAQATAEESLEIAWEFNLLESMGRATSILGFVEGWVGDEERAMELAEEALGYYRDSGNEISIAGQLMNIAMHVLQMGDYDRGREMMEEALELQRNAGDTFAIAVCLVNLGEALREMNMTREAADRLDEGLDLARTIGAAQIVTEALVQRSMVSADEGQPHVARTSLIEGMLNAPAVQQGDCLPFVLESCAALLTLEQDFAGATQMFAAAGEARRSLNLPSRRRNQEWRDRYMALCRAGMDEDSWESARKSGRALSPDAAISQAHKHLAPS